MKGRVFIVAGSDPSGGAGIQADIKTVSALGAYAAAAITMVTVQNTLGLTKVYDIPADIVAQQMRAVLTDIGADVIKLGALGNSEITCVVAAELARSAPDVPLVVDPVMVATNGTRLLTQDALSAFKAEIAVRASVLTPNIPEAEILAGSEIESVDDMKIVAERLLSLGPEAVLLTGGHLESDVVSDVLMTLHRTEVFSSPRIATKHNHGTGCTLASALAAGMAQGQDVFTAADSARDYVRKALRTAPGLGHGHGPLDHMHVLHT